MRSPSVNLTNSEWNVLECLWENWPQTVMQLVNGLSERVGWAKSTTITTLRRMEEKGLLHCETSGGARHYSPAVDRERAAAQETRLFLSKVYQGSIGRMMEAMVQRQELSREDISQIYQILRQAELGQILRKAEAHRQS